MSRRFPILGAVLALSLAGTAGAEPWSNFPSSSKPPATVVERGQVVFNSRCEICHGKGIDRAGTISLNFKYGGVKPALLEERRDLTPDLVRFYVRNGVAMMPYFRKTELSDVELGELAAYLSQKKR